MLLASQASGSPLPPRVSTLPGPLRTRRLVVRGIVEGVGFRPFVARLAAELGLVGEVHNDETAVFVTARGRVDALDELERRVLAEAPPLAHVLDVAGTDLADVGPSTYRAFTITPSTHAPGGRTLVPPDTAVCEACLRELFDPTDRRYRHPFITCTDCGPRLSIITDLPYDRPATTMAGFPLCTDCAKEYADPADRRFHAQPVACPRCGPRLRFVRGTEVVSGDDAALAAAVGVLRGGDILAVKGVGGYHLACDASSVEAVERLRERKHRPDKPFALMAADLATANELVQLDAEGVRALTAASRPVVLARRRDEPGVVAAAVAPGLDELGLLLPYAPVHHLLFAELPDGSAGAPPVLVMTSGNLADEPLCHTDADAFDRLSGVADAFLTHDRGIHVPVEDSVVAVVDGVQHPVRRSRGFAPVPVLLGRAGPVVLAVGAELKNTFCLTRGDLAFVSAHVGDVGSLETQRAFDGSVRQLLTLHAARPDVVAADLHPGYATQEWARRYAAGLDVPLVLVQHHHAHLASLLAEHGRVGTPALGLTFDGTGYGCDGVVWGGELLAVGEDVAAVDRLRHLAPFLLPGGEAAVRNPLRTAAALLQAAGLLERAEELVPGWRPGEAAACRSILDGAGAAPTTTSLGRLFDGVSALLGVRGRATYEAQAAVELEVLARTADHPVRLDLPHPEGEVLLDTGALVRAVVEALARDRSIEQRAAVALGFHEAVADAAVAATAYEAGSRGVGTVGLTGGAFANALLRRRVHDGLSARGLEVLVHRRLPCNDGGLSLGQAVVAAVTRQDDEVPG